MIVTWNAQGMFVSGINRNRMGRLTGTVVREGSDVFCLTENSDE